MAKVYNQEFKDQIVELHRGGGRTFMDLAKEFDLSATTVANWVRAAKRAEQRRGHRQPSAASKAAGVQKQQPEVESAEAKIARLERELARKNKELEILGKALAFFARRMDR
ncbi:MAG TPA: transposase [Pseudonocardiaceae bacterium]|nr:transposase [Pseudonocardiaceae bacterium]